MIISEAIAAIKAYSKGTTEYGKPASDEKDCVLYGQEYTGNECTGIVVTGVASVEVIRRAADLGANLIMCNAGMFWNHGDRTDWLQDDPVYQAKCDLLNRSGIVVWRNYEHVISGVPIQAGEGHGGGYIDGIAYGFAKTIGWDAYLDVQNAIDNPADYCFRYRFPEPVSLGKLARQCKVRAGLIGVPIVGDPQTMVRSLYYSRHQNLGLADAKETADIEANGIDCLISGELVDYTVASYVRDSVAVGRPKCVLAFGNFNEANAGMAYAQEWVPMAIDHAAPVVFVSSGDMTSAYVR